MELNLRTHYSIGKSIIRVSNLIDYAQLHNISKLAICDYKNFFGSVDFSKSCLENNIKPVIGITIYCGNELGEINVFIRNNDGFQFISKMINENKNFVDISKININDVFIIIGNSGSKLYEYIYKQQKDAAYDYCTLLKSIFQCNLFISLCCNEMTTEHLNRLVDIGDNLLIPFVINNSIRFLTVDDKEKYYIFQCIKNSTMFYDEEYEDTNLKNLYITKEFDEKLSPKVLEEAYHNRDYILDNCEFHFVPSEAEFPTLYSSFDEELVEFEKQCYLGMEERLKKIDKSLHDKYYERLKMEINIINNKGFPVYFLIVSEITKWAKANEIVVGEGRGSAVGCIASWCLYITNIDPIEFGLIFERFLNPGRKALPDIDIDICQKGRNRVIDHIVKTHGEDKCAHIITFGHLKSRMVIRDVGRVLHIPQFRIDEVCKLVPFNPANPLILREAINIEPKLLEIYQKENDKESKWLQMSIDLEGLIRQVGTHASGYIISKHSLYRKIPFYISDESKCIQLDMHSAENIGLVKFDLLGLRTITKLSNSMDTIKSLYGVQLSLDSIPRDDEQTFQLFQDKSLTGIFQFEGEGLQDKTHKLKPTEINDLIALVALYRPGPLSEIDTYIRRKFSYEDTVYLHPSMELILKETYGIIVYQEQVMHIAMVMANYSLEEADNLRRAMGKKKKKEMEIQEKRFINGIKENNIDKELGKLIFETIYKFASYAFNKSHAVPYGLLSFYTGYIKIHYPTVFFQVWMNHDISITDKLYVLFQDSQQFNITILPPDINKSEAYFTIEDNCIRYGIKALKGIERCLDIIITQRNIKPFDSLQDFLLRTLGKISKSNLETLVCAGCFDNLPPYNRYKTYLEYKSFELNKNFQQELFKRNNISLYEFMKKEKEAVGFYISQDPFNCYRSILNFNNIQPLNILLEDLETNTVTIFGEVALIERRNMTSRASTTTFAFVTVTYKQYRLKLPMYSNALNDSVFRVNDLGIFTIKASRDRKSITSIQTVEDYISSVEYSIEVKINNAIEAKMLNDILDRQQLGDKIGIIVCSNFKKHILPLRYKDGNTITNILQTYSFNYSYVC